MKKLKAFLICPVRGVDPEITKKYVDGLEHDGFIVHWPPRDTNQEDETGFNICLQNRQAIEESDCVFVVWDGKSQGCLFDLGMAFAMNKKIYVLNVPPPTEGKSFQNMMRAWENKTWDDNNFSYQCLFGKRWYGKNT